MASQSSTPLLTIIGLMSGTSVDGIDAALVQTDGTNLVRTQHVLTGEYRSATKQAILDVVNAPSQLLADRSIYADLETLIAEDHAAVVNKLVKQSNAKIDLLGFHGQTVYHQPIKSLTIQLGDASQLSALTGIATVHDFRSADMANGGQGAPIAPIYHQLLLNQCKVKLPAVMLNVGGISNITTWDGKELLGFDCGPGNCLMDDYMRMHFGRSYDNNGEVAASGEVDKDVLSKLMADEYFKLAPPKSLDRQYFSSALELVGELTPQDAMATLNAFTVASIAQTLEQLNKLPTALIVAGGGQRNKRLMDGLNQRIACKVSSADQHGLSAEYAEAELMAYLAARHHYQMPYTYPGTTGVAMPCCGAKTEPLS